MPKLPEVTFAAPIVGNYGDYAEIDEVTKEIVDGLLHRDLCVQEHRGRMDHYGGSGSHFMAVNEITGPDYWLELRRNQGRIGVEGVTAERSSGLSRVTIPGLDAQFFKDGSGTRLNARKKDYLLLWLREKVLRPIHEVPEVSGSYERLTNPPPIPYPQDLGPLLTWCSAIYTVLREQHAQMVRRDDLHTLQCAFGYATADTSVADLVIPGQTPRPSATHVVEIQPLWANDLVVRNYSAYQVALQSAGNPPSLSGIAAALAAFAATEVPISEYRGNYQHPVVYVRRHLVPEEALPVSGPWGAPTLLSQPDKALVAAMIQRDAAVEYERSLRLWRHYLTTDDFTEAMFAEVTDANLALVKALLGSQRLAAAFLRYSMANSFHGEPARIQDFVAEVMQTVARPRPKRSQAEGKTTDTVSSPYL